MSNKEYYVYRYIYIEDNTIIYIGKTDASLKQRIDAHEKEDKFQPYRGLWKIEYLKLQNNVETDIVEKYLINQYKPILNEKDNVFGLSSMTITLPEWSPYSEYQDKNKERISELCIIAKEQESLLEKVYDAVLSNKTTFISNRLYTSGILPFKDNSLLLQSRM